MISTIESTLEHVIFLTRHLRGMDVPTKISVMLMELRTPTNRNGFEILRKAILLKNENPSRGLRGDIYAEILSCYRQSSEEQVEQAIREVIKSAWENGSEKAWTWYFGYDGTAGKERPSNSEFISRIAYIIELLQGCEKGGRRK